MEVYILDDLLRRNTVIDRYESLIWTERYSAYGDFQLVIHSTQQSRSQLVEGTRLAINNSRRVMTIENVENKDDSEGRQLLTVTGRSLESILEDRAIRPNLSGSDAAPSWTINPNPPAAGLRSLFNYICVQGGLSAADKIPMYTTGSLYPANTIAEPDAVVTQTFDPVDLYKGIKDAADVYGLGFRLYRGPDTSTLYFDIYTGDDRTSSQTTLPAVIFAPDLENLTNTSEFRSIEKYKNVALVIAKTGSRWVYADDDAANATGFDRRVVVVEATDITDTYLSQAFNDNCDKRGKDELTKYKPIKAMDGELPTNAKYKYGIDYELGDLVEMRNDDGLTNRMRVTEQIFVDDSQGERSYPTLALDEFITPGTWYAWDANGVWDTAPGVWAFAGGEVGDDNLLPNGDAETGDLTGWATYSGTVATVSNVAGEFATGKYGIKAVVSTVNSGVAAPLSALAMSPVGAYAGKISIKTTTAHTYKVKIEEWSAGGALVASSAVTSGTGTNAFIVHNLTYTKQQPDSVLRISVQKDATGTFYVDNAEIRKVL